MVSVVTDRVRIPVAATATLLLAAVWAGSASAALKPLSSEDMARTTEENQGDVQHRALPLGDSDRDSHPSVFDVIERERDYNRDIRVQSFQTEPNQNEAAEQYQRIQQIIEQNTGVLIPGPSRR